MGHREELNKGSEGDEKREERLQEIKEAVKYCR